jgi:hypothetical protein
VRFNIEFVAPLPKSLVIAIEPFCEEYPANGWAMEYIVDIWLLKLLFNSYTVALTSLMLNLLILPFFIHFSPPILVYSCQRARLLALT